MPACLPAWSFMAKVIWTGKAEVVAQHLRVICLTGLGFRDITLAPGPQELIALLCHQPPRSQATMAERT